MRFPLKALFKLQLAVVLLSFSALQASSTAVG